MKRHGQVDGASVDFEGRYSDGRDPGEFARKALAALEEYHRTGNTPVYPHTERERHVYTSEERLAYYRSHGLDHCDDYPGGDAQFETDVLSGAERDGDITAMGPLKKEDAYIINRMNDGRFAYGGDFELFPIRPEVLWAYYENAYKHGIFFASPPYRYGWAALERDIKSGEYARRIRRQRGLPE